MNFGQAVSHCLRHYATFNGRGSRSEYWWFMLFFVLVGAIASTVNERLGNLAVLLLLLPNLAVGARRLHDIGKSAWFLLLNFVPLVGMVILIWWACRKGDEAPNEFGPPALGVVPREALPPGAV